MHESLDPGDTGVGKDAVEPAEMGIDGRERRSNRHLVPDVRYQGQRSAGGRDVLGSLAVPVDRRYLGAHRAEQLDRRSTDPAATAADGVDPVLQIHGPALLSQLV